jgi:hypothetical protein
MKMYYFEKAWRMNSQIAKKTIKSKRNKQKDFTGSKSGVSHQVDEYYLKSDVDKLLKELNK